MKILVTGFEAFNGEQINPSEEIIKALAETFGEELYTLKLPVEFREAEKKLVEAIARLTPDITLSLGQAAGRECITIERVAINVDDAKYPDNFGYQPEDITICEEGATAYFTTLPLRGILACLAENGIEARISNTAGTYVCNHVMYQALHLASTGYPDMKAGFIHVPYMKEQTEGKENAPYMELSEMIRAAEIIIRYLKVS
ncbi:pyroglutamyl-peptidase I [Anaerocolumna xylanovorans]|uniref:Pyroglutamyl-peptidase I n=1 Tax=Anaerocolumna xylanovorans DSM 12503 TaxID=1121345 RepID=A0A1M7Y591_9FIRM|nr:pyroglutamyl-peptidase I [Anaerocolumna xylanovorans]SHO47585.1 pyroglutamyl-peptidase [Anaerocolumna xylanovorans DSM 12503]